MRTFGRNPTDSDVLMLLMIINQSLLLVSICNPDHETKNIITFQLKSLAV